MLSAHGMALDYVGTARIMNALAGKGEQLIDFDRFLLSIMRAGARGSSYQEEMLTVLRCVFNSYDKDGSGVLEKVEYLRALEDCGRGPTSFEESTYISKLLAACHQNGEHGPL